MKEIWKDIKGYEGYYQISNMGRVKSLERTVWNGRGYRKMPEKILKPQKNRNGYLQVPLSKEGTEKKYYIHRLVANAFIPNPQGLPEINHLSEDKTDNRAENLEFCTSQYNKEYSQAKAVIAVNKVSGLIMEFNSIMEAERTLGIDKSSIVRCCKGKQKSAVGYTFAYVDQEEEIK